MSGLRLPRILSDGAVLQRRKTIHIWGWDEAGSNISVALTEADKESTQNDDILSSGSCICKENGRFDMYLPARESGGPYKLVVSDDKGEEVVVSDVMIGLVWFCSGQSNMELPVIRVKDKYPELLEIADNNKVRTFKITEDSSFEGPLEELRSGSWTCVSKESITSFSATGYFFADHLQKLTGQTVGFRVEFYSKASYLLSITFLAPIGMIMGSFYFVGNGNMLFFVCMILATMLSSLAVPFALNIPQSYKLLRKMKKEGIF